MAEADFFPTSSGHDPVSAPPTAPTLPCTTWQAPTVETLQSLLPQYEILGFVSQGTTGAVYKAVQRTLERTVAIKILLPQVLEDDGAHAAERFHREARAMALLEHTGIVAVHHAGEAAGHLYLVMEFVEGTSLADVLKDRNRLPPDLSLKVAARVCDALAYAHERGLVHRDLKPSNIMVDLEGNVKVTAFGLARLTHSGTTTQTLHHLAGNSSDFAAPELLQPGQEVDQRADLYAVGALLYQMLTGRIPRGNFDKPSALAPIDRRFDAIIEKAMQTDRERRYSSALELHRDLDLIPLPPARTKRTVAAALVFALGIAAAATVLWLPPADSGRESQNSAPRTPAAPYTNSLGMVFVPVPGIDVRFCIHETRHQDYAAFAVANPGRATYWQRSNNRGVPAGQEPDHPVVSITWQDARDFCAWLSATEGQTYRLATDREWSAAVGLGGLEDASPGLTPAMLHLGETTHYPWGYHYPPLTAERVANLGDLAWHEAFPEEPWMTDYEDGFATTAPVMSFAPNAFGIYDLAGNADEFCEDWFDETQTTKVVRGSPYHYRGAERQLSSYRWGSRLEGHYNGTTFRCVLVPQAPSKSVADPAAAAAATADPDTNSLGMKFVPLPGTRTRICIHETRRQDYAAFAAEEPGVSGEWMTASRGDVPAGAEPDHPVVMVSWKDAQRFCAWLSRREQRAYRLPTDAEWSLAVELDETETAVSFLPLTPELLNPMNVTEFPWRGPFPPRTEDRPGNLADEAWHQAFPNESWISGYRDGFPTTAPVMSFKPNQLGIYDLAGNVDEFCQDWYNASQTGRVMRGTSYHASSEKVLLSSSRRFADPARRYNGTGFRIVTDPQRDPP